MRRRRARLHDVQQGRTRNHLRVLDNATHKGTGKKGTPISVKMRTGSLPYLLALHDAPFQESHSQSLSKDKRDLFGELTTDRKPSCSLAHATRREPLARAGFV